MGYNPLRKYRGGKLLDVTILVVVTLLIVSLVYWASR